MNLACRVNEPTINRFTAAVETQRVLNQKTRTIVFARYSYEDVRLFNLQSLVVRPILQPDRAVRLSRFGASFVRDTRERCERGLLGAVRNPDEETGAPGEICRYNQVDATRGDFFNVDYAVALRQLGGNLSFNRLQATYRRYYKVNALRGTVFAGNATLGLANLFNPRDRDGNGQHRRNRSDTCRSANDFSPAARLRCAALILRKRTARGDHSRRYVSSIRTRTRVSESVYGAGRRQRAGDCQS